MNALSPEGFTPADSSQRAAEPVARPAAGRRGPRSAPAAGGDQVRLMVDLEDEGEIPAGGVVLDESAGDGTGAGILTEGPDGGSDGGLGGRLAEAFEEAPIKGQGEGIADGLAEPSAFPQGGAHGILDATPTGVPVDPSGLATDGDRDFAASGTRLDPPGAGQSPAPSQAQRDRSSPPRGPAAQSAAWADASAHGLSGRHMASSSGAAASSVAQAAAAPVWDRPPPSLRTDMRVRVQAADRAMAQFGMPAQLTGIEVTLSVQIGCHQLSLRDLLTVEPGLLVPLDRMTSEPVDILVNGRLFARGEVVAIGDRFGVRLLSLVEVPDAG